LQAKVLGNLIDECFSVGGSMGYQEAQWRDYLSEYLNEPVLLETVNQMQITEKV
jgi:hypothetical protein